MSAYDLVTVITTIYINPPLYFSAAPFYFSPFLLHAIATVMAVYRCRDHCRELRKELNTMAGIYKPPIRLAILDSYAGQTGDLFKVEITALYTNALPSRKGWSSPIFVFSSHFLWRSCERPLSLPGRSRKKARHYCS